jgi:tetratricopeptide (TPR) repeat protein
VPPQPPAPPLDAFRIYLAGNDLLNEGRYIEAADTLARVIEIDPAFGPAYYKRAIALWWVGGDPDLAKGALEPLLEGEVRAAPQEKLMAEAAYAMIDRDYEKGISLYREISQRYPDEKEGWYGLGEALFHAERGLEREAKGAFDKAIDLDPSFILAYQHIFDIAFRKGDYQATLDRVHAFVQAQPDRMIGYSWWVELAAAWGNEEEIERALAEGRRRAGSPKELQRLLTDAADGYRKREDLVRARALYEEAAALGSDLGNPDLYAGLAGVCFQLSDFENGKRVIEEISLRFPQFQKETKRAEVELLLATGDEEGALHLARRHLEEDENEVPSYVLLGRSLAANRRFVDLGALIDSIVGSALGAREKSGVLENVSQSLLDAGQAEESLELYEKAREIDPRGETAESRMHLAWILLRKGDYDRAEPLFRGALAEAPFDARAGLAVLELCRGNLAEAEELIDTALNQGPKHMKLFYIQGLVRYARGKPQEALASARRAASMDGRYLSNALVAWILIDGDIDVPEGLRIAERVKKEIPLTPAEKGWLLPDIASIEHVLGLGYLKTGRLEEAVERLEEAAMLQPDRKRIAEDLARARALP